jgi:molecular chaperone GrpE
MIKDKKVLEGLDLIEKELKNSFKNLEIEEIESKGQHFDPKYHNVVAIKQDNTLEDGIVIEVYQAGYKLKDRIIRYAQVVVNKNQGGNTK